MAENFGDADFTESIPPVNVIWFGLVAGSVCVAALTGHMDALSGAMMQGAKSAVELCLGLIGGLCLWLGLMRVVERAGLLERLSGAITPIMRRLFPSIPAGHPATGAMVMNLSANILGMDNAATAFGLRAMRALDSLNRVPGTATDAMALFLAINTAGISAVPVNVIAARATFDPQTAGLIVAPTITVTCLSMLAAIGWMKLLTALPLFRAREVTGGSSTGRAAAAEEAALEAPPTPAPLPATLRERLLGYGAMVLVALSLVYRLALDVSASGVLVTLKAASGWLFALLAVAMVGYGVARGVRVYEAAVEGAQEGFSVAIKILPYLVIILAAVAMFRASTAMDALVGVLSPVTDALGMPAAVLPQALVRPLSGSAAMGLLVDVLKTHGPNSLEGYMASVIYGSSETTFYVVSVYFGAISVTKLRQALIGCLLADLTGIALAVAVARLFY